MKNNFVNKYPFFIAEISGNHGGKINNAKKLIYYAKRNGADAIKLQTYTPEMMTLKQNKFIIRNGMWANINLWDLYQKAYTPLEWHRELFQYAKKLKIKIFSTPFSIEAVDFLEKLNCQIYKISSFEMTDLNLVKKISLTNKPIIMSTGMASIKEIKESVKIIRKFSSQKIYLLYCISNYPSDVKEFNLNNIKILKDKFKCDVGLSDHSIGSNIACMSIINGARIIEKHICLDNIKTVDSKFSLKISNMKKFVDDLKTSYQLINKREYLNSRKEKKNKIFRRSIFAIRDIKKGEKFTNENIKTYRPNIGLGAEYYYKVINKKSPVKIKKYSSLKRSLLKYIL